MREDFIIEFEDIDDVRKFIIREVTNGIERYGYQALRDDLWRLTRRVSSSWFLDNESTDFNKLVDLLQKLVEGAWQALEMRRRYGYNHTTLEVAYIRNPFRGSEKLIRDTLIPEHLDTFLGKITCLTKEECRNFFIAFENLFQALNVVEWRRILEQWRKYAYLEEVISTGGWDSNPLVTYEALVKLVEASALAASWAECPFDNHPNKHLFRHGQVAVHMDPHNTDNNNPLQEINWIMAVYNATILKDEITHWLECAAERDSFWNRNEPGILVDLYQETNTLMEAGWMLTRLEEIPESWLDPDGAGFQNYSPPLEDRNFKIEFLSESDAAHPVKVPARLFRHCNLAYYRSTLTECVCHALQTSLPFPQHVVSIETVKKILLPLVEALYLINLELSRKRTKPVKPALPPVTAAKYPPPGGL